MSNESSAVSYRGNKTSLGNKYTFQKQQKNRNKVIEPKPVLTDTVIQNV